MVPHDEVISWAGEPIATMTHERLLEVFQTLARMYRDSQTQTQHQFAVLRSTRG